MQNELNLILADLTNIKAEVASIPYHDGTMAITVDSIKTSVRVVTQNYTTLEERKSILWLSGCISMLSLLALLLTFKSSDRPVPMIRLP